MKLDFQVPWGQGRRKEYVYPGQWNCRQEIPAVERFSKCPEQSPQKENINFNSFQVKLVFP